MTAQPKRVDSPPLTELMLEAMERLSELPDERQDELARMLLGLAYSEQSELSLTPEQQAELDAALAEDGPYATAEEMETFFKRYRT